MDALAKLRAATSVAEVFSALLSGSSKVAERIRADAAAISSDVLTRGALVLGPPGTGKSTLARAVALGRYVHLMKASAVPEFMKSMSFDGPGRLATDNMDWYREQSLTGLVDSLADTQLFGIGKKVASGVDARDGIFRLAMHGLPTSETAKPTAGAAATEGVVFLDEIGDLPASLQPKLLTVLTGAKVYPVGLEGDEDSGYAFRGLTLAATWRKLDEVRPDLRARLSDYVIRLPPLSERLEDLPELAIAAATETVRSYRERLLRLGAVESNRVDKERFASSAPEVKITDPDVALLRKVDWPRHGDLRGLAQIIRASISRGISIKEAIEGHEPLNVERASGSAADVLAEALASSKKGTLSRAVVEFEQSAREELVGLLRADTARFDRVVASLGCDAAELRKQLADLVRDRRR